MKEILVYKAEVNDGLIDKIKNNCSIAYCIQLSKRDSLDSETTLDKIIDKSQANFPSNKSIDLYLTKSVFVTTNWNKNDDVFDPSEVWSSRHTLSNKPTNLEHDEHKLVGHMTDSWAIDENGTIIADDTSVSDLPNVFHVCNGAVIYKSWEDQELKDRTQKLISEIEAGTKFVSMEVLFTSFDYAVESSNGDFYTVTRNDESAFLTKHLRSYGGSGEYDGHKIGRLLKNLIFSGKGYVDKPANPESIIFSSGKEFGFSAAKAENPFILNGGVYISQRQLVVAHNDKGDYNMSEVTDTLKTQLDDAKAANKVLQADFDALNEKLVKADVASYESNISELKDELSLATTKLEEVQTELVEANQKSVDIQSELAEAIKEKEEAEEKISLVEAEALMANRITSLVDGGLEKTDAKSKVETFKNLDDEQFKVLAIELVKSVSNTEKDEDVENETDASEDKAEVNANDKTLENAKANEEVDGAVGGVDEIEVKEVTESLIQLLDETRKRN